MTFDELKEKYKNIDLKRYGIYLGEIAHYCNETVSCLREGDLWKIVEINDRQQEFTKTGTEEEIIRKMNAIIKLRIR